MREKHPDMVKLLNYLMNFPIDEMIRSHIDGCETCHNRLMRLRQEKERVEHMLRPESEIDLLIERNRLESDKKIKRIFGLIPSFGIAVAILIGIFLLVPRESEHIRLKGGLNINVYVNRDNKIFEADNTTRYRKGDKIRFEIISPITGYVSVFSKEGSSIIPIPELQNIRIDAQENLILPGSLELECSSGADTVFIMFDTDIHDFSESAVLGNARRIDFVCRE